MDRESSPPPPLEVAIERLQALEEFLNRSEASREEASHRPAVSLALRHLHRLAAQVELQAELHHQDLSRIQALRRGLERVVVSTRRQAEHYEQVSVGEARTWRHVQHLAERRLADDDLAMGSADQRP